MEAILKEFAGVRNRCHLAANMLRLPQSHSDQAWSDVGRLCKVLWQRLEDEMAGSSLNDLLKAAIFDSDVSSTLSLRRGARYLSSRRMKYVVQIFRERMLNDDFFLRLERIQNAYSPALSPDDLFTLLAQGPTEEQRYIGTIKYVGGVKMDGSVSQVRII